MAVLGECHLVGQVQVLRKERLAAMELIPETTKMLTVQQKALGSAEVAAMAAARPAAAVEADTAEMAEREAKRAAEAAVTARTEETEIIKLFRIKAVNTLH